MLRLGAHPEVGVCFGCARFLQRRAAAREDELHPSPAARARSAVRGVRSWVIARGWHNRGLVGKILQRLDRYLP